MKQISILVIVASLFLISCKKNKESTRTKELLIYCGITMVNPISDIARIIEKQEDCKILIRNL
jgi:molybdate transport system substrate-binding protein